MFDRHLLKSVRLLACIKLFTRAIACIIAKMHLAGYWQCFYKFLGPLMWQHKPKFSTMGIIGHMQFCCIAKFLGVFMKLELFFNHFITCVALSILYARFLQHECMSIQITVTIAI